MLTWKRESAGETALLIEGPRRVGKSRGFKLCPIEVKSAGYSTHKSLDEFCQKYSHRIGNRYLVYTKDLRQDEKTLMVPVYMVGLL